MTNTTTQAVTDAEAVIFDSTQVIRDLAKHIAENGFTAAGQTLHEAAREIEHRIAATRAPAVTEPNYPSLYDRTGDIKDINTMLVPRTAPPSTTPSEQQTEENPVHLANAASGSVHVEAVTDESGTDYRVKAVIAGCTMRSDWTTSESRAKGCADEISGALAAQARASGEASGSVQAWSAVGVVPDGWKAEPVKDGFKLVPIEPSEAMLDRAVAFALNVSLGGSYGWTEYMRDLYARMLSAVPEREAGSSDHLAACAGAGVTQPEPPGEWGGLTPKQAWWAGYRIGKGLPADMPRAQAVHAVRPLSEHEFDVLTRCAKGIADLAEICRRWEPDHSSGEDRRNWMLAKLAEDDARDLLATSEAAHGITAPEQSNDAPTSQINQPDPAIRTYCEDCGKCVSDEPDDIHTCSPQYGKPGVKGGSNET